MSITDAMAESTESPRPFSSQRKPKSWPFSQSAYLAHLYVPDIYVYDDDPLKFGPKLVRTESFSSKASKYLNHLYYRRRHL